MASSDEPTVADGAGDPTVPSTSELQRGARVGRYTVVSKLGAGGMGVVYGAYDPELDRRVALKLLHPALGLEQDDPARHRLLREAQAMAKLQHPNVAAVYDAGVHGASVFLAMELIDGVTARAWQATRQDWREVVRVYVQAARGLAAAHAAGLIHRDFKPDNVMIDRDGRVRVMDFGLARAAGEVEPERPINVSWAPSTGLDALSTPLTEAGAVMGTPAYMAPEQHLGLPSDPRTDQFAFCVALFEALYGQRPFAGETAAVLAFAVTQGEVRDPPRSDVPARVRRAALRGLSGPPKQRWADMDQLVNELEAATRRHAPMIALGIAAVVLPLGVAVVTASRDEPSGASCSDAGSAATSVWTERRDDVEAALTAEGRGYARDVWARVDPAMQDYADAWALGRIAACERTASEPELADERAGCYHDRLVAFTALIDVLAGADAAVVTRAVQASAGLPLLHDCEDPEWLLARVKPPSDPDTLEQVEAARAELARGTALELAGSYADAVTIADTVELGARELGYPPVVAEALFLEGSLLDRLGDSQRAQEVLAEAYFTAAHGEHDEIMGRAALTQVFVLGYGLGRPEDAKLWARLAGVIVERRPALAGDLASARAAAFMAAGEWAAAAEEERKSLAIRREALGERHPSIVVSLNNLGAAYQRMGQLDEALEVEREALALGEDLLGADHPVVSVCRENIGLSLGEFGRWAEAKTYLEVALTARLAAFGERHPQVASSFINLGIAHSYLGDVERAIESTRKGVALRESLLGAEHPETAFAWHNLGAFECETGKPELGLVEHRRALASLEKLLGLEHPALVEVLTAYADCLAPAAGDDAVELLERALALDGEVEPITRARTQWVLGRVLWESQRDRVRATDLLAAARTTWTDTAPRGAKYLTELDAWLEADDRPLLTAEAR